MSSPVDLHNPHSHANPPANTPATTTATTTTRFVDPFVGTDKETAARRASDGSVGGGTTPLAKRDRRLYVSPRLLLFCAPSRCRWQNRDA